MKIKELRVGNWIYDHTDMCELQMSLDEFQMANNYTKSEHPLPFKPIPLTEEWLIRFGFQKRESGVCDAFHIGLNPITHDWLFDITWLKNMIDYSYEGNPFYKNGYHEIKYVHQLQNLYFALTNQELTIK